MDCEYHFALTQRAKQDVRQNVGYIRNELGNEKAAGMLMNELDKCIERLCVFPESGKLVFDEYLPGISLRRVSQAGIAVRVVARMASNASSW